MIVYFERMITQNDYYHNFTTFKLVATLHKLGAVSKEELDRHVEWMENSRPAGIMMDYVNYRVVISLDEWVQF